MSSSPILRSIHPWECLGMWQHIFGSMCFGSCFGLDQDDAIHESETANLLTAQENTSQHSISSSIDQSAQLESNSEQVHLSDIVGKLRPGSDPEIWKDIEKEYPECSRCFAQLLEGFEKTEEYRTATPEQQLQYGQHVETTIDYMQQWWPTEKTIPQRGGFVDFMMRLSQKSLGNENAVIHDHLANAFIGPLQFKLVLTKPFNQSNLLATYKNKTGTDLPVPGFCIRATTKWLACQLVDQPFKYRNLHIQKTADKQKIHDQKMDARHTPVHAAVQQKYIAAYDDALSQGQSAPSVEPFLDEICETMLPFSAEIAAEWLGKFTDGNRTPHMQAISIEESRNMEPSAYFAQRSIEDVEGCLIQFTKRSNNQISREGHIVAVKGGKSPLVFDANYGEYRHGGPNFGQDLQKFIETVNPVQDGDRLYFMITSFRRNETGNE